MNEVDRRQALDRFYGLLDDLDEAHVGRRRLVDCQGRMDWPKRGVYFFFEEGEVRDNGVTPRVVRVGTHALRPSKSTLWGRLSQHKGSSGGSMPGGGNHRGSIFRLHVGTALLEAEDWPDGIRQTWTVGSTADRDVRWVEYPLERAVSDHIGSMPFLWLEVDDPPGTASDRGLIEAGALALLSNVDRGAVDPPSASWLGRSAARDVIGRSGLWNVNHVADKPTVAFLDALQRWVSRRPGCCAPPGARG